MQETVQKNRVDGKEKRWGKRGNPAFIICMEFIHNLFNMQAIDIP